MDERSRYKATLWVLTALSLVTFITVMMKDVRAHDAPSGWTYPVSCCSDYDCREVDDTDVIEGPDGYVIRATGELIPMTSTKVRSSPDGAFHWCSVAGKDDGATICLFVPPRSY